MPWPPALPPDTRANGTALHDNHPTDHNTIADALTDIVAKVNTLPSSTPVVVSANAGNGITAGSDGGAFHKQLAYVVAKTTQPTAADYGLGAIPVGAVWVQTP
jgi:hypothetical protein